MTNKKNNYKVTKEIANEYEMLSAYLCSLIDNVKSLSDKKPDGSLNKLKVDMINTVLFRIQKLLQNEQSLESALLLDDETLPTNSDALMILTQFRTAMSLFENARKSKNSGDFLSSWSWTYENTE